MAEKESKKPEQVQKKAIVKKRTVDKWKKKVWFNVFAPKEFERKEIGTTISEKPESVVGRKIEISVRDLAGQPKGQHVSILFKIVEVKGNKAYADAFGHTIRESYLRKFTGRRSSKVETVQLVSTKDNASLKVKTICLTGRKVDRKKEKAIRKIIESEISSVAKQTQLADIVSDLVFGNLPQKILSKVKKVSPIKRIEIVKSRLISKK
ncbi:MAG: hypothetical protein J4224_03750 [Candidatus Diapherotrites archaeon]|uniref:Small ribosomal subunit protein eS1 n=1 Tax=Candidatus Iainarchaeum sp. TaxID=3101447 RepID=A0A7J4IU87_9ARCH|nr:MAG: small subunit ribosomal protein S3Ae [archaeon GW2011_AR10]MBS3059507.1 hypothetical protein [Candidatus Diapherotrites archaeon]HIH08390.1 hypothetical protein [Candidatus Diapherotrites archaeon]